LILDDSQRRILLPVTGKLIIGRFDPELTEPLDVDLTCEDQAELSVSRRHAQIEGVESHHTIEDLGSANGVFVNGVQLTPGRNFPLLPGNQIMLGRLHLHYETVPTDFLSMLPGRAAEIRHFLLVTHTGRKIEIAPPDNIIIGRADPEADYVPGIDLAQDGEVAFRVSRRHARIVWSNQLPYLKDLTSTFGTRFNGDKLHPGRSVLLRPGDHVSLGGCVLAYDILL
jgi:pSer/pThr/pTyr-binding forkhead associated (FHA) protein